jgi:hypothetical protein
VKMSAVNTRRPRDGAKLKRRACRSLVWPIHPVAWHGSLRRPTRTGYRAVAAVGAEPLPTNLRNQSTTESKYVKMLSLPYVSNRFTFVILMA